MYDCNTDLQRGLCPVKSLYALLCTAALAAALSGSSDTDYSNSTLTGQVTTKDGTTVTL